MIAASTIGRLGTAAFAVTLAVVTPSTAAAQSPSPSPTAAPNGVEGAPLTDPDNIISAAIVFAAFGTVVIIAYLIYLAVVQWRTLTVFVRAIEMGVDVAPENVVPLPTEGRASPPTATGAAPAIIGPGRVIVGEAQTYTLAGPNGAAVQATWRVTPADAAELAPTGQPTSTVSLRALKAGKLTLAATLTDGQGASPSPREIEAISPTSRSGARPRIPFVGQGHGSVILATVALAVIAVVALTGVLNGQGVASLLGALFGYIFFRAGTRDQPQGPSDGGT